MFITIQEYMIRYKILNLGIEDRAIVQARSTGRAEELLQKFLEHKHSCQISFVILSLEELSSVEET